MLRSWCHRACNDVIKSWWRSVECSCNGVGQLAGVQLWLFNVYGDRLYVQMLCYVRCVMYGVLVECQQRMEVKYVIVHNMCTCAESQRRSSTGLTQLWSLPIKVFHNWGTCMFFITYKMMEVLCTAVYVPGTVYVQCSALQCTWYSMR